MNISLAPSGLRLSPPTALVLLTRAVGLVALMFCASAAWGASDAIEAVKKADADRIAATFAHDGVKLGSLLSEDLVYGQNDGKPVSKGRLLSSLTVSQNNYTALDYEDARYTELAPGVVVMTARGNLKGASKGKKADFFFRVLAVWRKEGTAWKLFAYQSARTPDSPANGSP